VTEGHLQDLIRYRIERARETFEEALLMQREGPSSHMSPKKLSCPDVKKGDVAFFKKTEIH